jgi:hypothetical protein
MQGRAIDSAEAHHSIAVAAELKIGYEAAALGNPVALLFYPDCAGVADGE